MARRGRFGRLPRAAPSLAATIIAIAREMMAQADRNLMDAWKNGGVFEGGKATDERVLAYWKSRMAELDPQDPEYDTTKNQYLQLQYAVEQSKADLQHLQGKLSDRGYADFFLKWAKKVPKDSEFWRSLQKDAAQLIESAKAKGRAAAAKAKTDAYNKFVADTTKTDIAVGNALTDAASKYAAAAGLNITADGDLVLEGLTEDIAGNPAKYQAVLDAVHAINPGWDGNVTQTFFASAITKATAGYAAIAVRSQKDGYVSRAKSAVDNESQMASWGANLKVWPIAQSYDAAYNQFVRTWSNPNASQLDRQTAAQAFSNAVGGLASTTGLDPATAGMLEADAARAIGQDAGDSPSFGSGMLGHGGIDANVQQASAFFKQQSDAKAANPDAFVYAATDAQGNYDPTGNGPLGIVPRASVPGDSQMVAIPQLGGKAIMAVVPLHSITVTDPSNPNAAPIQVGSVITYRVGDAVLTMYGYPDSAGKLQWTLTSPVADGVSSTIDKSGNMVLSAPATSQGDLLARAQAFDAKYGTTLVNPDGSINESASVNIRDSDGKVSATISATIKNGIFAATQASHAYDAKGQEVASVSAPLSTGADFNIATAINTISPSLRSLGNVPGLTFDTPLAASVKSAAENLSAGQVSALASDREFQQAFLAQAASQFGTTNIYDSRIAEAWRVMTTVAISPDTSGEGEFANAGRGGLPQYRTDLQLPGSQQVPGALQPVALTFGQNELRLPRVPGISPASRNIDIGVPTTTLPTFAPPQPSYLPTLTPTVTPTATPIVTPTATPLAVTPTPTAPPRLYEPPYAAPTPAPTPSLLIPKFGPPKAL